MATSRVSFSRQEGTVTLLQDDAGIIRLAGPRPRGFESLLVGRDGRDAIYLTQQISADSAVSHALAAALALEAASEIAVPHNGLLLRDLLHMLSFLHAHLRQFYFQALPEYIPQSALAAYKGDAPELLRIAQGVQAKHRRSWTKYEFSHPFQQSQLTRIAENQLRAQKALSHLQRMMAVIGGKFPMVMSIVPGGVTVPVTERLIIKLRGYLGELAWIASGAPLQDGLLLVDELEPLKTLGRGKNDMISAGTLGDDSGPDLSMFPRGVLLSNSLARFQPRVIEKIQNAFYRVPLAAKNTFQAVEPAPGKAGAYSWIKSPRYGTRRAETGALARFMVTHLSGSRSDIAPMAEIVRGLFGPALSSANTVAGRMVARLGELQPLLRRCGSLLDQLTPGQPSVTPANGAIGDGDAAAGIEAPAGMVQHRLVLSRGRIAFYDVISPSTWNGAPRDENDETGGLESALNADALDLQRIRDRRQAYRIVLSYFFSATDAVQ